MGISNKPYTVSLDPAKNFSEEEDLYNWTESYIGKYDLYWDVGYDQDNHNIIYYFTTKQSALLFSLRWS